MKSALVAVVVVVIGSRFVAPREACGKLAASTSTTAAPVPAWRGLVLVLAPPAEDELTRNAMVRIVGEFGAALFQVVMRPVDPGVDLMVQLEKAGSDLAPLAAFAIVRDLDNGSTGVAVWVSNRMTRTTTVQRVQVRSENVERAAAQLAIETVDLVRASVAGVWPIVGSRSETRGADSAGISSGASSPVAARFRLAVGAGTFRGFDSVPATWAPEAALLYGRPGGTEIRFTLVGLGSGTEVTAADGSGARLQRAVLSVGVVHLFRSQQTLQPLLSAAVGAHRLGAQGTGAPDVREHDRSAFSALLSVGAGGAVALGAHLALTLETEAMFLLPSVVVRVGQTDAARLERPSVFTHAGLLATF